jgi:ketosteroid isomerase-like protein
MPLTADDHTALQQLYARHNHALDFGDAEGYVACFTEDGAFEVAGTRHEGTDGLAAFARAVAEATQGQLRHWTSNLVLEGSGEGARGRVYVMGVGRDEGKPVITGSAVYHDELRRGADGEWRFHSRTVVPDN